MNKYIPTIILLLACFWSCDGEVQSDNYLVHNSDHVITVEDFGTTISVVIENISDLSNDISGPWPDVDFASITVDVNQNGLVDSYIDVSYGSTGGSSTTICTQYLITENLSTSCGGFNSNASFFIAFADSDNSTQEHPIWTYTIPKTEIFLDENQDGVIDDNSVHFVIKIYKSGAGYTTYPKSNQYTDSGWYSFNEVLKYP